MGSRAGITGEALAALERTLEALDTAGARVRVTVPGVGERCVGKAPALATVRFRDAATLAALRHGDHLSLAEAHLEGRIDLDGDLLEIMKVTESLSLRAGFRERLRLAWRLLVRDRRRYDRESIAFHYDRPFEFFEPWLGRWRCYSHGLYESLDETLDDAMERKLAHAVDRLRLEPGMRVLDMGGGWGCFVEYAGLRGIHVHAITISAAQHRFVAALIREKDLPCQVELVNFRDFVPAEPFDAAVFMGTFEHNPEYERAVRWLTRHLSPGGRVWADFCAQRTDFTLGAFMKKYVWPGPITYVNTQKLVARLIESGFNVHELEDDTLSYACSVRDWARGLEAGAKELSERFGERDVRIFRLFLRGSEYFLFRNRTQAYHLVAGRDSAPLGRR